MRTLLMNRVDVACLSEVLLSGSGYITIAVPQQDTTFHLYHNGKADNTVQHGVPIALSAAANASLLDWAPFSSSLTRASLKADNANVSIVAVNAPTLCADDDVKGAFYSQLQGSVDEVPNTRLEGTQLSQNSPASLSGNLA